MTTPVGTATGVSDAVASATLVLLCADLRMRVPALDLEEVASWLSGSQKGTQVRLAEDLCSRPDSIGEAVRRAGSQRLVLGRCAGGRLDTETCSHARRAGLDPLGIQAVDLESCCGGALPPSQANARAKAVLAAAVARAEAYPGSQPENLKAVWLYSTQEVSRRALFTLPPVSYVTAPTIHRGLCNAGEGCDQCVQVCPRGALERDGDAIRVNRRLCLSCGLCVASCPQRAVEFPGWSPEELEGQTSSFVQADLGTRDVVFTCKNPTSPSGAGWLGVDVPCAAMVSCDAILQTLAAGATTVGIRPCSEECPTRLGEATRGKVDFCRRLLQFMGGPQASERVRLLSSDGPVRSDALPPPPQTTAAPAGGRVKLFGRGVAAEAVRELAAQYGVKNLDLEHPYSPLGHVQIDGGACTGCATCAMGCPTGALSYRRQHDRVAIVFDASLCTACAECERLCPERDAGAIVVTRGARLDRIAQGPQPLFEDQEARCEQCGGPIAARRLLDRIAGLLGNDYDPLNLARRCPDCRGR